MSAPTARKKPRRGDPDANYGAIRLVCLIHALARDWWHPGRLAREHCVDVRTIYRDLVTLEAPPFEFELTRDDWGRRRITGAGPVGEVLLRIVRDQCRPAGSDPDDIDISILLPHCHD